MKIVIVADKDTNMMFGLIGIESFLIEETDPDKFQKIFDSIIEDKEIGVIILNEKFLFRHKNYFKTLKMGKIPIIVEIPDMNSRHPDEYYFNFIKKYIDLPISSEGGI